MFWRERVPGANSGAEQCFGSFAFGFARVDGPISGVCEADKRIQRAGAGTHFKEVEAVSLGPTGRGKDSTGLGRGEHLREIGDRDVEFDGEFGQGAGLHQVEGQDIVEAAFGGLG